MWKRSQLYVQRAETHLEMLVVVLVLSWYEMRFFFSEFWLYIGIA